MSFLKKLRKQSEGDPSVKKRKECGSRPATKDDGLCDSCRFSKILTEMHQKKG